MVSTREEEKRQDISKNKKMFTPLVGGKIPLVNVGLRYT
jgi:hypothetical protein